MAGQLQSEDWVLSLRSPKAGPTSPKKAFLPDSLELAEASDAPPLPKGLQPKKKLGHLAPILRPSGHKPHAAKGTTLQGGKTGPLAAQKTTVQLREMLQWQQHKLGQDLHKLTGWEQPARRSQAWHAKRVADLQLQLQIAQEQGAALAAQRAALVAQRDAVNRELAASSPRQRWQSALDHATAQISTISFPTTTNHDLALDTPGSDQVNGPDDVPDQQAGLEASTSDPTAAIDTHNQSDSLARVSASEGALMTNASTWRARVTSLHVVRDERGEVAAAHSYESLAAKRAELEAARLARQEVEAMYKTMQEEHTAMVTLLRQQCEEAMTEESDDSKLSQALAKRRQSVARELERLRGAQLEATARQMNLLLGSEDTESNSQSNRIHAVVAAAAAEMVRKGRRPVVNGRVVPAGGTRPGTSDASGADGARSDAATGLVHGGGSAYGPRMLFTRLEARKRGGYPDYPPQPPSTAHDTTDTAHRHTGRDVVTDGSGDTQAGLGAGHDNTRHAAVGTAVEEVASELERHAPTKRLMALTALSSALSREGRLAAAQQAILSLFQRLTHRGRALESLQEVVNMLLSLTAAEQVSIYRILGKQYWPVAEGMAKQTSQSLTRVTHHPPTASASPSARPSCTGAPGSLPLPSLRKSEHDVDTATTTTNLTRTNTLTRSNSFRTSKNGVGSRSLTRMSTNTKRSLRVRVPGGAEDGPALTDRSAQESGAAGGNVAQGVAKPPSFWEREMGAVRAALLPMSDVQTVPVERGTVAYSAQSATVLATANLRKHFAYDPAHGDIKLPLHISTPALVVPVATTGTRSHAAAASHDEHAAPAGAAGARAEAVIQLIGKAPWSAEQTALAGVFVPGSRAWNAFAPVEVALTSVLGSALGQALRTWDAWQAAQKHHMRRVMLLQETRQLAAIQEPSVLLYELACLTARACNAAGAVIYLIDRARSELIGHMATARSTPNADPTTTQNTHRSHEPPVFARLSPRAAPQNLPPVARETPGSQIINLASLAGRASSMSMQHLSSQQQQQQQHGHMRHQGDMDTLLSRIPSGVSVTAGSETGALSLNGPTAGSARQLRGRSASFNMRQIPPLKDGVHHQQQQQQQGPASNSGGNGAGSGVNTGPARMQFLPVKRFRKPLGGLLAQVVSSQRPCLVHDVTSQQSQDLPPGCGGAPSMALVPIFAFNGSNTVIGVLQVLCRVPDQGTLLTPSELQGRRFTQQDIDLLQHCAKMVTSTCSAVVHLGNTLEKHASGGFSTAGQGSGGSGMHLLLTAGQNTVNNTGAAEIILNIRNMAEGAKKLGSLMKDTLQCESTRVFCVRTIPLDLPTTPRTLLLGTSFAAHTGTHTHNSSAGLSDANTGADRDGSPMRSGGGGVQRVPRSSRGGGGGSALQLALPVSPGQYHIFSADRGVAGAACTGGLPHVYSGASLLLKEVRSARKLNDNLRLSMRFEAAAAYRASSEGKSPSLVLKQETARVSAILAAAEAATKAVDSRQSMGGGNRGRKSDMGSSRASRASRRSIGRCLPAPNARGHIRTRIRLANSQQGFSMDGVYEEAPPDVYDPAVDGAGTSPWGVLAVPLTSPGSDEVYGILSAVNKRRGRFNGDDVKSLQRIARQASVIFMVARASETRERIAHTSSRLSRAVTQLAALCSEALSQRPSTATHRQANETTLLRRLGRLVSELIPQLVPGVLYAGLVVPRGLAGAALPAPATAAPSAPLTRAGTTVGPTTDSSAVPPTPSTARGLIPPLPLSPSAYTVTRTWDEGAVLGLIPPSHNSEMVDKLVKKTLTMMRSNEQVEPVHQEIGSIDRVDDITGRSRPLDILHIVPLTGGTANPDTRPFGALVVHNTAYETVSPEEAAVIEIIAQHAARVVAAIFPQASEDSWALDALLGPLAGLSGGEQADSNPRPWVDNTETSVDMGTQEQDVPETTTVQLQLPSRGSRAASRFAREASKDLVSSQTGRETPSGGADDTGTETSAARQGMGTMVGVGVGAVEVTDPQQALSALWDASGQQGDSAVQPGVRVIDSQ